MIDHIRHTGRVDQESGDDDERLIPAAAKLVGCRRMFHRTHRIQRRAAVQILSVV
jgi:hypothetical protein